MLQADVTSAEEASAGCNAIPVPVTTNARSSLLRSCAGTWEASERGWPGRWAPGGLDAPVSPHSRMYAAIPIVFTASPRICSAMLSTAAGPKS
jgi:hypothetical protein